MRVWLDRNALAARGLTVDDVEAALRRENVELPAGRIGVRRTRDFTVRVQRGYRSAEDFRQLVRRPRAATGTWSGSARSRTVELGAVENAPAVPRQRRAGSSASASIAESTANTLAVSRAVSAEVDRVKPDLPEGMDLDPCIRQLDVHRRRQSKRSTSRWPIAIALVLVVIWLFLGDVARRADPGGDRAGVA